MPRNVMTYPWRDDTDDFQPLAGQKPVTDEDEPPPPRAWLREQHRVSDPEHWVDCGCCRRERRGLPCTIRVHVENGCEFYEESDRRYWARLNESLDPDDVTDTLAARRLRGNGHQPRRRVTRRNRREATQSG